VETYKPDEARELLKEELSAVERRRVELAGEVT
jgi:hypothetical protein